MIPNTNGQGLNLLLDKDLEISDDQVLDDTANTESTNTITLGSENFPKGQPIKGNVFITALVGTLAIKVCGTKTGVDPVVTDLLETINVDAAKTGVVSFTLPQDAEVTKVNLFYTAGTSGTVSAYLTSEMKSN